MFCLIFTMPIRLLDYFRVKDWLHILGIPTLGFVYNSNFNLLSAEFVSILLLSSLGLAFGYSFDANYNKFKSKSKLLPSLMPLIAGLIYASFLNAAIFLLSVIAALIMTAYVIPPFRFKGIPILVTISNSAGFSLLFLVGYAILSNLNADALLLAIFIGIAAFPIQLVHEIAHFSRDKKNGLITTPIKFGKKFTYSIILISLILLVVWSSLLYIYLNYSILFAVFSATFSLIFALIMKHEANALKSRIYIKYLSIVFGLSLLFIFLFKI